MVKQHAAGFSLVEVLVSVFVLALGVIGATGMHVTALRTSQQSGFHAAALQLATELADRMRANPAQMQLPEGDNLFLGLDFSAAGGMPDEPAANCFSTACNGEQLAEFDLYGWQQRLAASLPGVRAVVCRDASPLDEDSGRLNWECEQDATASLVVKIGWAEKDPAGQLVQDLDGSAAPAIALLVAPYAP